MDRSAWVIVRCNTGRMLLVLRSHRVNNGNVWNFIGGGVEPKEIPREAAIRELKEEAGLKLKLKFCGKLKLQNKMAYFFVAVVKEEVRPKLNRESSGFRWVKDGLVPRKPQLYHKPTLAFLKSELRRDW